MFFVFVFYAMCYGNKFSSVCRVTISSRAIPTTIHGFADSVRAKIKEVEGKMVSLKVDGCTKHKRYFVGINIQYDKDGKSMVRTLAVEELTVARTAQNLKILVGIVLKRFDIEPRQIVSFTTDSGANYVLAGKKLCEFEEEPETIFEDGDPESWIDSSIELSQDDFNLPSVRCPEHTLQLAVEDAIKAERRLEPLIKMVRQLAKYLTNETQVRF